MDVFPGLDFRDRFIGIVVLLMLVGLATRARCMQSPFLLSVAHRAQTNSTYSNYREKQDLREALVREQRGLSCYCLCRIVPVDLEMKVKVHTVDHARPVGTIQSAWETARRRTQRRCPQCTELRRQGITFLAFYVLQRCVEELEVSAYNIRCETGLQDYEVSRACRFLAESGLVEIEKSVGDARVRVLKSTDRGRRVHDQVLLAAARQFEMGVPAPGRLRRLSEAAQLFQKGNRVLLGGLQLSFFDVDLFAKDPRPPGRRNLPARTRSRSKRSEP